jgi:coniferyl-aldehyde dehydrogenase
LSLATSTILDRRITTDTDTDASAIATLHESVALQKAAFRRDPYPAGDVRSAHIQAFAGMLLGNRDRIRSALTEDFGSHPVEFTDLLEILGPAGRAGNALESLEEWMAQSERRADPALFGSARAAIRYEPKGVVGNMAPWNFPFEIGCGPVVEMLAAGNRVIIKPSDLTPVCGELLAELVAATFDRDHVTVAVGGLELAKEFSRQRWDHLMYTGSAGIGRQVMRAAAEHLVPVTLELGGKCPAVLTPSGVTPAAVESIIGTKLVKNGQMCITVDHVLLPREQMRKFVDLARSYVRTSMPDHSRSKDCVGMISDAHLVRIEGLLEQARGSGAEIVQLEEDAVIDRQTRRMPLALVLDPDPDLRLCREEIFGPILPIIPYDTLPDAAAGIDLDDRPLALYVFGEHPAECEAVVRSVRSGGACVNACALQGALPALGFGGSGSSGMGRHHGIEGFREFSNARGVVVRGQDDHVDILYPPYGEKARSIIEAAFTT